jgi:uncharacterized membrane protein YccC
MRNAPIFSWLRELVATVTFFDRSALEPGFALRCTLGVAIPLTVAVAIGRPALGVAPAVGAFITGFTSLQGVYRTRLTAILIAALGMALTSFVGAVAAGSTPGIIAAMALAAYASGTIGQIGPIAATVALNSLVAFVLFSSQAMPPAAALQQSGLVLVGGLIQALLLLAAWPSARCGAERLALAGVYRNLAAYAHAVAAGSSNLPPITPLATARQILADPQPFGRAGELARLQRLLEDSESVRRRLGAIAGTLRSAAASGPARGFVLAAAAQLDEIANVLMGRKKDIEVPRLLPLDDDPHAAITRALAHDVADAALAASMLSTGRLPRFALLSKPQPGPYVRNHVSWRNPDSLRFAIVLAIAMALGRHFEADRGYWIPLTAALVLKPDFQTTFVRGFGRIAGTLVGAVVAALVIALVRGHPIAQLAGLIAAAAAAYLTFNPNYALFTIAITSFVVIVLSLRGLPGTTTIDARVLDTLAGGTLAMIGYLVWPTWERKRTRALLADLIDAQRRAANAILREYVSPSNDGRVAIERARTATWEARTAAETSIDRMRSEPRRPHTIGAARALRILSATQRFGLANLALETALDGETPARDGSALAPFAQALDDQLTELAHALRESRRARVDPRLAPSLAPLDGFMLERAAAYAEAVTRIARLIGVRKAA